MTLEQYLQARYSQRTARGYLREITIYLDNYPAAAAAGYEDVTAWLGVLRNRYDNASTLNRTLASIKAYYAYLVASGQRQDHPARAIYLRDLRSRDVQLQDLFTAEEMDALLTRTERFKALSYRNRMLVSLLVYQGLKPLEIAQLKTQDIDLDAGTVYTAGTATTHARTLPLKPAQVLLFYGYIQDVRRMLLKGNVTDALVLGLRGNPMAAEEITKHVLRSYKGQYAPRVVSARSLRQSVIANLLKAGRALEVVQQYAGHKYPSSTERYRQHQVTTLQAAVAAYHPMG